MLQIPFQSLSQIQSQILDRACFKCETLATEKVPALYLIGCQDPALTVERRDTGISTVHLHFTKVGQFPKFLLHNERDWRDCSSLLGLPISSSTSNITSVTYCIQTSTSTAPSLIPVMAHTRSCIDRMCSLKGGDRCSWDTLFLSPVFFV